MFVICCFVYYVFIIGCGRMDIQKLKRKREKKTNMKWYRYGFDRSWQTDNIEINWLTMFKCQYSLSMFTITNRNLRFVRRIHRTTGFFLPFSLTCYNPMTVIVAKHWILSRKHVTAGNTIYVSILYRNSIRCCAFLLCYCGNCLVRFLFDGSAKFCQGNRDI